MKRLVIVGLMGLLLTSCARVNIIDITPTGARSKTYSGVSYELEFLPDGTRRVKFSNKKGKPLWERITEKIRPDSVVIGDK